MTYSLVYIFLFIIINPLFVDDRNKKNKNEKKKKGDIGGVVRGLWLFLLFWEGGVGGGGGWFNRY